MQLEATLEVEVEEERSEVHVALFSVERVSGEKFIIKTRRRNRVVIKDESLEERGGGHILWLNISWPMEGR